ncbi:protein TILLER ANGLE CONTROL 1-like isoform X2 [Prosopis cineraria]|uniref:protein TILLER ANGLE CONTROL 1-like isoform X2 n=1 Tax=Prosopis cineraria TaxID=364024 RepID=UPI00240F6C29|nr:protein TILLER ANGLE CONTROL 1-like isoform X2 [Prosopis cineraria]
MKIFNWVHRTFLHSALKDGFESDVRKAEPEAIKRDDQASLKEVALVSGWKDGILTIGTLGCYGPFKTSSQHKDYLALESDEDEAEKHEEEENYCTDGGVEEENKYWEPEYEEMKPLIHTKFENNFEDVVNEKPSRANAAKVEALVALTPVLVSDDVTECIHVGTEQKEKKSERITLADLFLADSEKIMKHDAAKVLLDDQPGDDKQSLKAKRGQPTFAKKLISGVNKDNPHPINNIRKLMKKMIKKKIHPEVDVKNKKSEDQKPSASEICENQKIEGTSG